MHALVTGGGGFLGFALVKQLLDAGYRVRSFSRQRYATLDRLGVESMCGDLSRAADVQRAVQGVDIVFHVAARAGVWGKRQLYYQPNVIGTEHIVAACLRNGVKYLIYTGSPSVTFDGQDHEGVNEDTPYTQKFFCAYQETKTIAEQYVRQDRSPELYALALRPHLIWGVGDPHFLPRLLERAERLRFIGKGENLIDTTYISDAAAAHLCAAQALRNNPALSGRSYFITSGDPQRVSVFLNALLAACGRQAIGKKIPRRLGLYLGTLCETAFRLLGSRREPPLTYFVAAQLATSHWYDISRAKQELGYHPHVSLAQGCALLQAAHCKITPDDLAQEQVLV